MKRRVTPRLFTGMNPRRLFHVLLNVSIVAASTATQDSTALESECARFAVAQNASLQSQWQLLSSGVGGPYTRISHAAVALSSPDRVLVIGGIAYESAQPVVTNTTIVYDPATDAFTLPVDQILSSVATASGSKNSKDDVFVSPASRVDHAATVVGAGNTVVVFGGQNKEFLNDLWRLCIDNLQAKWDQFTVAANDAVSLAAAPVARIGHSLSVFFENSTFVGVLVYGGLSESYVEVGGQLHLGLIAKSSATGACSDRGPRVHWRILKTTTGTAQPAARSYHAISPVSKLFTAQRSVCLFLYGGRSVETNTIYSDIWRLCPVSTQASQLAVEAQEYQWQQLTPVGSRNPGPRHGSAIAFVDEGKIAIAGGSYTFPNDFLRDCWEFNVNASQWLALRFDDDFLPARRGHSITLLGDRLFLFGGRDRYSVVSRRMQVATYAAPYCETGFKITLCDATSSYVCVPCPAGYYLESGTRNCLPCSAGSFSAEGAALCSLCPKGTYNILTAQKSVAACIACPAGSFSNVNGATALASCTPCAAGTFASTAGTAVCSSCVAGTFSNANATTCSPCDVGEWSASSAASCSRCAAGTYTPRKSSASCFACPKGFYSDDGAASCLPCAINTFNAAVASAGAASCVSCPALAYTADTGSSACDFCAPGSSYRTGSGCVACAQGSYSAGSAIGGDCLACPLHTYANESGSAACSSCPPFTLTTATGATSAADCHACLASSSQYFDGASCRSCAPGSFLSTAVVPSCEACSPGTYTSTSAEASDSSGCVFCPTMTTASSASATSCASCPDNSFAMAAWHSCISCVASTLATCPMGRNGLACSGHGTCFLRGCDCASGWTGGDCSVPIAATTTGGVAVLYVDLNESRVISTWPPSPSASFTIRVQRSGSLVGSLSGRIQVKTSNTSTLPPGVFPVSVTLASGVSEAVLSFSVSSFAVSVVGANCRSLTLELADVAGATSPSAVAADAVDRTVTLLFDDMNGPSGASPSNGQPRTATATYRIGSGVTPAASVAIDRLTTTNLRLSRPSGSSTNTMPLHFRVVIDPLAVESGAFASLLPAAVARIQAAYASSSVRFGLLSSTASASVYQSTAAFFTSASTEASPTTPPSTRLSWQSLASRLTVTNTTQWAIEDATLRRFIIAFVDPDGLIDDVALFAAALRQHAAFAWVVLPPGRSLTVSSTASEVVQVIPLASIADFPRLLADALQTRDATPVTSSASLATLLIDAAGLVSSVSVSIEASSPPSLDVTLEALPSSLSSSSLRIGVPGFLILTLTVVEPGPACASLPTTASTLPFDVNAMGGWISPWHLLTDAEWSRRWVTYPATAGSVEMRRYNDSSLLCTAQTAIAALTSLAATRNVSMTRSFDGDLVAPGLDLIVKGYVRHSPSVSASVSGVVCAMALTLIPATDNHTALAIERTVTTQREWQHIHFSSPVPFEVATMALSVSCLTTTSVRTVEWTSLGLFPDPQLSCLCPRGFFYDIGACIRCPAGSYCVAGIKRECPLGYFSFGKADRCEKCRDGWICVGGLVRLCDAGTYASPDSTCAICPAGYACRNGKKAVCPTGTFSLERSSDCQLCPPGTISVAEGSSTCALCGLGSTSNYERDHCVSCIAGETTLLLGQHACRSCAVTAISSRASQEICVSAV